MNSTAQLPGVNRPLSVELRLINFCSCGLDSHGEHDTSSSRGVLTKQSDFPRTKGAVRCSPFGGVEFGKTSRLGSTRKLPRSVDTVRLVAGGSGDHRQMARALQRNQATRCAGKPAASALPRGFARRGNSSLELSTRRGELTDSSLKRRVTTEQKL